MYDTAHPAYDQFAKIGREITSSKKVLGTIKGAGAEDSDMETPEMKAVVVFSAHWQAKEQDTIEINTAEKTDLIYEYVLFNHPAMVSSSLRLFHSLCRLDLCACTIMGQTVAGHHDLMISSKLLRLPRALLCRKVPQRRE